jgi:hypothetical protein
MLYRVCVYTERERETEKKRERENFLEIFIHIWTYLGDGIQAQRQHSLMCSIHLVLQAVASWDTGLLRQFAGNNILLCSIDSVDSCPKAEPREQRGLTLYTLASRLQNQKAKSNPYMVIFNFIGYFILVLRDFPLPGAKWPSSCSAFSGLISLVCHPYIPATFSGLRPSVFSSDPPPCYTCTHSLKVILYNILVYMHFDCDLSHEQGHL